jgi:hypothetical protein
VNQTIFIKPFEGVPLSTIKQQPVKSLLSIKNYTIEQSLNNYTGRLTFLNSQNKI